MNAKAVSVDIIYNLHWGNMLREETFALFARALREGALRGFLTGPPCETWSRARAVASEMNGVRPLRSRQQSAGLPFLNKKESVQVSTGNLLLGVTLRLFLIALLSGSTAVIEHPAEPDDEQDFPSIWRLPVVQMLMRFEGCQRLRIQQGQYGAPSCKPTDLLIAHADAAEQTLCSGRITRVPMTTSIGKDESGCWKTSKLKEYPGALCRALAAVFDVSQPLADQRENLPEWFPDAITKLVFASKLGQPQRCQFLHD